MRNRVNLGQSSPIPHCFLLFLQENIARDRCHARPHHIWLRLPRTPLYFFLRKSLPLTCLRLCPGHRHTPAKTKYFLSDFKGINQVFFSLMPQNIVKATFVDFIKESTSISVEYTLETLITEIATHCHGSQILSCE